MAESIGANVCLLPKGLEFIGKIKADDLRIEGAIVKAEIQARGSVNILHGGSVEGAIVAKQVHILAGTSLKGSIYVFDGVEISAGAIVDAQIKTGINN